MRLADDGMTARELVLHLTNVMAFAIATLKRKDRIRHEALEWSQDVARFYALLRDLDEKLAEGAEIEDGMELRLVQGPLRRCFDARGPAARDAPKGRRSGRLRQTTSSGRADRTHAD